MEDEAIIQQLVPTLFEDDHLLAVTKPAGVDASQLRPGSVSGLAELLAEVRCRDERFHVANRLTRHESGVLLLGKDATITEHIRAGLKKMRIAQEYVAVAHGRMTQLRIHIDPGQDASHGKDRRRGSVGRQRRGGLPREVTLTRNARTTVTRIRAGKGHTLLRCRTTVSNTHALRAQLRSAGLRLLGDSVGRKSPWQKASEHTCLHLSKIAFFHPARGRKITIAAPSPDGFASVAEGSHYVQRALQAALVRRLPCIVEAKTDSYRLLTGDAEDVKGLVAEKFGCVVVLQVSAKRQGLGQLLPDIARWYRDTLRVRAVYVKHFGKKRGGPDDEVLEGLSISEPLVGKPVPEQIEIVERGLNFAIRPYDGFSVGLFLDQRENRSRVRSLADGKDVLNLFAYTCGFSVAAAAGGASSTTSVDISPKHLEWGRANFALNRIDLKNHSFIRSDAGGYFERARRQHRRFDLIVLDPPTFSHGRKRQKDFSVDRDLRTLIAGAVSLLRPGGIVMISTNYRRLSGQDLRERLREGAAGRRYKEIETPLLPLDFAPDPDHAKTIFAQFQ